MAKINIRKHDSFIKELHRFDKKNLKETEGSPRKRLQNIAWPSESMAQLGSFPVGECRRTLFYKILGAKETEPMSIRGRHICDAGILYESYHIRKFKKLGIYEDEQIDVGYEMPNTKNKVIVSGRMDCLVKCDGLKQGIEIKSVSAYKAPKVMGDSRTLPLPATNNLMQAMLYKYFFNEITRGKDIHVDEVYLMYINRSDNAVFFYNVDLNPQGYPIIAAVDDKGNEIYNLDLETVPSLDHLVSAPGVVKKDDARLAELRININDIFKKFDMVYDYSINAMLPQCDYSMIYNSDELEREHKLGRLSKVKYNKAKKGEAMGDKKCEYCSYRTKCMADSGITLS